MTLVRRLIYLLLIAIGFMVSLPWLESIVGPGDYSADPDESARGPMVREILADPMVDDRRASE